MRKESSPITWHFPVCVCVRFYLSVCVRLSVSVCWPEGSAIFTLLFLSGEIMKRVTSLTQIKRSSPSSLLKTCIKKRSFFVSASLTCRALCFLYGHSYMSACVWEFPSASLFVACDHLLSKPLSLGVNRGRTSEWKLSFTGDYCHIPS